MEYYDRIFGARTDTYRELLEALADELVDYAETLGPTLSCGDPGALSRLRHAHRPMVENLRLSALQQWEDELRQAVGDGNPQQAAQAAARLVEEARAAAAELTSVRLRDAPEPR